MSKYIAIYARQSKDKKDSISIETQIDLCKKLCENEELKIYFDKGFSGKNIERPEFQKLLNDIKNDKVSKVITYKLDRISRSIADFSQLLLIFEKHNVDFKSATENFDTSNPMGRAMINIIMTFAQLEREQIAERLTDNWYSRAKLGFWCGGKAPLGHKVEKRPDSSGKLQAMLGDLKEELESVRKIGMWYLEDGGTIRNVTVRANAEKLPGVKKYWDSAVVRNLLKNPIYVQNTPKIYEYFKSNGTKITNDISEFDGTKGLFLYASLSVTKRHKLNTNLSELYLSVCNVNPVFTDDEWLKIQNKMLERFNTPSRTGKGRVTFLGGLIKCKYCGATVGTSTSKIKSGTLKYFVCGTKKSKSASLCSLNHIRLEKVEEKVIEDIIKHVKDEEFLNKVNNFKNDEIDDRKEKEKSELENKIVIINDKINNLINALAEANDISIKYINSSLEKLDQEKLELEAKIKQLYLKQNKPNINIDNIKNIIKDIDLIFNSDNLDKKKEVAKSLIDKVILSNNNIHIIYKI